MSKQGTERSTSTASYGRLRVLASHLTIHHPFPVQPADSSSQTRSTGLHVEHM